MHKKYISLLLALALILSLAACGAAETVETPAPTAEPTPEPAPALPAGSYSFSESAMGGAFTVEWELELREDGTYTIIEHNPFMGDLTYEGEYEWDGETVTTLPFEGEPPMAEFFEADKSCLWTLDGENCKPVKYTETGDNTAESGELTDIKYASNSEAQVLDIHQPEGAGPNPVIVLVHGGGFLFGDQAMPIIQPVIDAATQAGYAVVSVDYRKSGEAAFPAALPADFALRAWIQVGDADQNVPYTQSVNFAERLAEQIGAENVSFSVIEGAAHEDDAFYTAENLANVLAFLDGVMK